MDGSMWVSKAGRQQHLMVVEGEQLVVRRVVLLLLVEGVAWASTASGSRANAPALRSVLLRIRRLRRDLPDNHIAVFQEEVGVTLNPEIGLMWQSNERRGNGAVSKSRQ